MPPPADTGPVTVPFHFFEIGFAPNAWRLALLGGATCCAAFALLTRRRAPIASRFAWGLAASLLAGGLAFEAFLAWFPHDRWSGVFFVLGAPLAAGLGIGWLAGRGTPADLTPDEARVAGSSPTEAASP